MANEMQNWYEAAKKRSSIRIFSGKVPKDDFFELKDFADGLRNDKARIEFRAKNDVLSGFSIFGGVDGTNCFAAVIVRDKCRYMGGYIGEAFLLECISRGYGTCWLGTGFKRSALMKYIDLDADEKVVAVIAVGKPDDIHAAVGKKSIDRLTGLERQDYLALPRWQQDAANTARLAPSARNRQPWELDIQNSKIRIISNATNFGFGDVDLGIAMLHIELGAAKHGVYGDWEFENGNGEATFIPFSSARVLNDKESGAE
ncbi:MAG: nitroreductase family protein [Clostridia bacterium]|nr:nitroreductase family protein [Clostridia bacterium]